MIYKELLDPLAYAKAVHSPGLKDVHMVKTEYFTMPMIAALEKAGIRMDLDCVDWNLGEAPSSFTDVFETPCADKTITPDPSHHRLQLGRRYGDRTVNNGLAFLQTWAT